MLSHFSRIFEVYKWFSDFPSLHYKSDGFNLCNSDFFFVTGLSSHCLQNT